MATALLLQLAFRFIVVQGDVDLLAVEAAAPSLLYEKRQLEDAEFHSFHLSLLVVEESLDNLHAVPGEEEFRPAHGLLQSSLPPDSLPSLLSCFRS